MKFHENWPDRNRSYISGRGRFPRFCERDKKKSRKVVRVKQSHCRPLGSQEVEVPRFLDNRHLKVVRLSAIRTGRLHPGTHFSSRLSRPQGPSATGRIMSMKNSNDTIGNRTRDLPACSVVPRRQSCTFIKSYEQ
jgi:hypothetical protein